MSKCSKPVYRGPELRHCCDVAPGGTPVIRAPIYDMVVTNPGIDSGEDCDFLQEDDDQFVLEDNNDFLCVDNV